MIASSAEKLFNRWKFLLAERETFSAEDVDTLQSLIIEIREAGSYIDDADERDRLARLARTVARAVAQLANIAEPDSQLNPFEEHFREKPRIEPDGMPPPSRLYVGREDKLWVLNNALADKDCRIVQVVGIGGQGKTQLVNRWLEDLQQNQTPISAVFCYSFYTFPSHTFKRVPGFIEDARTFFLKPLRHKPKDNSREQWAEDLAWLVGAGPGRLPAGRRRFSPECLAEIQSQRIRLLILDGLEAALYLKDGKWFFRRGATAIKTLLTTFLKLNSGFCLITTRFKLDMLEPYEQEGLVRTLHLEGLSDQEGGQFLGRLLGNGYTDKQLARVSNALQGHPVSILAFGDILADQALSNPYLHQRISLDSLIDEALQNIYEELNRGGEIYDEELNRGGEIYDIANETEELLNESTPDSGFDDENDQSPPLKDENSDVTYDISQGNEDEAAILTSEAEPLMDARVRGVIRSYLRYFIDQGSEKGQVSLQLFRLMAFFQSLTCTTDLQVLIRLQEGIPERFNDKLRSYLLRDDELDQARLLDLLKDLISRQLIQERLEKDPTSTIPVWYDAHPILRGFFRAELEKMQPEAWRMGHHALAVHFSTTLSSNQPHSNPTDREDILFHYRAVEHACQAREWALAYEYYWSKIHHNSEIEGDDNYQWFAWETYGLQSTDIRALAFFYREPSKDNQPYWQTLEPSFQQEAKPNQQVHIRIATSLCLLSLGFLKEAGEPLNSCYQSAMRAKDNLTSAMLAGLLGDRALLQGNPADASRWLKKAHDHAKKHNNPSSNEQVRSKLSKLGNLHVYVGEWPKALEAFDNMLKLHQSLVQADPKLPKYPFTRSGFYYSDYLLTVATLVLDGYSPAELGYPEWEGDSAIREAWSLVQKVYDGTNEILKSGHPLNKHEQSFNKISMGWASGILSSQSESSNFDEALQLLGEARTIQEDIEQRQDLPRTLLLQAHFLRMANRLDEAMKAVNDCLSIAWAAGMQMYECDAYLIRCQIVCDMPMSKETLLDYYLTAQRRIEDIGYKKRYPDLENVKKRYPDLEASLKSY